MKVESTTTKSLTPHPPPIISPLRVLGLRVRGVQVCFRPAQRPRSQPPASREQVKVIYTAPRPPPHPSLWLETQGKEENGESDTRKTLGDPGPEGSEERRGGPAGDRAVAGR